MVSSELGSGVLISLLALTPCVCYGISNYMAACRNNDAEIGWLQNCYLIWPYTEPIQAGAYQSQ